jgi:hypothetical protein
MRFMSERMRLGVDIVVGATSVCGGFGLVEQVMDDLSRFTPLDRDKSSSNETPSSRKEGSNGADDGDGGDGAVPSSSAFDSFVASFPKWM